LAFALVGVFAVCYAAIALEHPLKINKSASALLGAGLLWIIYAASSGDHDRLAEELTQTVGTTAKIVFFLMGAMTIVEVIDAHDGFEIVTSLIRTRKLSVLLWLIAWITFFLSAILDNLTTTIVMVSLLQKLLDNEKDRLLFAGMIVIAANAGGAWSPMGDVTTTMLWIGGQVSATGIVQALFLASVVNLFVPLCVVTVRLSGRAFTPDVIRQRPTTSAFARNFMFALGLGVLVFVPAFKQLTHLPPFLGILFGLGIVWLAGEILHRGKASDDKENLTVAHALTRIDMSSIVFFTGILLAVATLEHAKILAGLAGWLEHAVGRQDVIVVLLGLLSAVVDNVPLVAATIGMYGLSQYPVDSFLWEFIAYCAGTGGSILIIGSAAGVAAMGIEKINFIWYLRNIGWLALIGYLAGAAVYVTQYGILHP
jgi:Na+/H+ antiporter NhaD/arsenite permease-like protein